MVKDSYEFSTQGLRELKSDLRELKRNLKTIGADIESAQVSDYVTQLHLHTPLNLKSDIVVNEKSRYRAVVQQTGEQVLFSEFGTGWYGEISPRHPQEGEVKAPDREAYQVNKTQKTPSGWWYVNDEGKAKWTLGEPAGMQNYKAFKYVVQNHTKYATMLTKGVKK